jgi:hypothetical protein
MLVRQCIIVYGYGFPRGSTVPQTVINEAMISFVFEVFDAQYYFHSPEWVEISR